MCGIFGYVGARTNAAKIVLDGLKALEYRGYDSWGVGAVSSRPALERVVVKKKTGKIGGATVGDGTTGAPVTIHEPVGTPTGTGTSNRR